MGRKTKRLHLSGETVRRLTDSEMRTSAGGGKPTDRSYCAANPCGTHPKLDSCVIHMQTLVEGISVVEEWDEPYPLPQRPWGPF